MCWVRRERLLVVQRFVIMLKRKVIRRGWMDKSLSWWRRHTPSGQEWANLGFFFLGLTSKRGEGFLEGPGHIGSSVLGSSPHFTMAC